MVSQSVKTELKAIAGEGRYFDNPEDLLMYSYDAFMVKGMPEVVLLPVTTEEVSRIMKVASRERIPVTPPGRGNQPHRGVGAHPGRDHPEFHQDEPDPRHR